MNPNLKYFFFTMNPNLKYFLYSVGCGGGEAGRRGGGARVSEFISKNPNLNKNRGRGVCGGLE